MPPMMTQPDEDDTVGSAPSHRSASSRGSSRGETSQVLQYMGPKIMCGAVFTAANKRNVEFVCFTELLPCRRQNHKYAP